jgi:ribokinase
MTVRDVAADVDVCVVGSVNRDLLFPVNRLPRPGQTVLSADMVTLLGGKGANQAVAAARLGRAVALLARVGEADSGVLLDLLSAAKVDTCACLPTPGVPSGHAALIVARDAENFILVSPGANARLSPADVAGHRSLFATARVCLVQQEIPAETVAAAVDAAADAGATVILNPAPCRPLAAGLLARIDVLVPNAGELADLVGAAEPTSPEQAADLLRRSRLPCRAVIVTLGARGAIVAQGARMTHVPSPRVEAVDTVGAGDAFCGALADALARRADLVEAAQWAVHAASLAVTRPGAQMPTVAEVRALVREQQGPGPRVLEAPA